jgi:hypothetical protein
MGIFAPKDHWFENARCTNANVGEEYEGEHAGTHWDALSRCAAKAESPFSHPASSSPQ